MNFTDQKRTTLEPWLAGGLITLAAVLTYGVLLPKLGFYRDDWYMLWAGQSKDGLSAIINLFQTDRPLAGWTYALIYKLIGANLILWQVMGLILRILTGLSVLWLLRLVWPGRRFETTTAALLFTLYPGYYQQPVAGTFNIDLLGLNFIFISIGLTIYSIRTTNRPMRVLAVLAAFILGWLNLGLYEGTIGLEVVRWLLVWLVLQQNNSTVEEPAPSGEQPDKTTWTSQRIKTSLRSIISRRMLTTLAPYLVMLASFLTWRLVFFKSVRRATSIDVLLSTYASNPLYSLVQVLINYLKDLFETVVLAWFVPFYQFTVDGRFQNFLAALGVALLVLALSAAYLAWFQRGSASSEASGEELPAGFLLAGAVAVLIPSVVIVLLGRNVFFALQWDHYTTQSMFGAALFVTALSFKVLRQTARRVFWGVLIILSVMTQYHSAAFYRDFWNFEKQAWQQLTWRAPGLAPGANVVVALPGGFRLAEEYEIWGPVNMLYNPGESLQTSGQVLNDSLYFNLVRGDSEQRIMRNVPVSRDYANSLIMSISGPGSCLHVYDGARPELAPGDDANIKMVAPFSKISMILPTGTVTSTPWLSTAPPADKPWCWYYEKISLARQFGDWQSAARLSDEALQGGLKPVDLVEWMPLLESYATTGQAKKANDLAKRIKSDADLRTSLCQMLGTASSYPPGYNAGAVIPLLCGSN